MNPVTTPQKQSQSATQPANPLLALQKAGQSIWLDYIRRDLISSGELRTLIQNDGLRGMTSNPSIFEKAISGSPDYSAQLDQLIAEGLSAGDIFERVAVKDIQDARP
jgi:transaldolase